MFIGVVDGMCRQVQCVLCFDGGIVVVDCFCLVCSLVVGIQCVVDGYVVIGKEYGVFVVVDVFCIDVEMVMGGDYWCGCYVIDGFSFVVYGGGSDGDVVIEDVFVFQVVQGLGDDYCFLCVNEVVIDQCVGISDIELQVIVDQCVVCIVYDGRGFDFEQCCCLYQFIVGKCVVIVDIDVVIVVYCVVVVEVCGQFDGCGLLV